MTERGTSYEFDDVRVDLGNFCVSKAGRPVHLEPKAIDVLVFLVEHRGRLIDKRELLDAVWKDAFVTENAMTKVIAKLRKTLGDGVAGAKYIETVPTRGYRFVADVQIPGAPELAPHGAAGAEGAGPSAEPRPAAEGHLPAAGAVGRLRRLGWPALLAGLIALAGAGYLWVRRSNPGAAPERPPLTAVAVLPFKPLVAGSRDEALEMGMADTLITRLGAIEGLVVRPVAAVRKYAALEQDPLAAGRELRVQAVLEGSLQRDGDRLRVTVRLLGVPDGQARWARTFDEQFGNIFVVQDRVAEEVARSLRSRLSDEDRRRLARHHTEHTEAYQLYLKGRYMGFHTEERARTALEYFRQAIAADPNYALAWAGLADAHYGLSYVYVPPREAMPRAKEAALKALELDESLAEAHLSLALVKTFYDWDWAGAGAEREFERAIELKPHFPMAHAWYGWLLVFRGRHHDAIRAVRHAHELDPVSLHVNWSLGVVLYFARRYDEAIRQLKLTLEMDPDHAIARIHLGRAYLQAGAHEQALAEMKKASGPAGGGLGLLGHALAVAGRRAEAEEILRRLKERRRHAYVPAYAIALIHVGLGERDAALEWLDRAYQERSEPLARLGIDPAMDPLRSDPRFTALLRRVELGS